MKHSPLRYVALSIIIFSCSDDEPSQPKQTTLLRIDTDQSYFDYIDSQYLSNGSDNWVTAHDSDGNLLAAKQFSSAGQYELTTDKPTPEKFTITHFNIQISNYDGYQTIAANTYVGIPKGKRLILRGINAAPHALGSFQVSVSGVSPNNAYSPGLSTRSIYSEQGELLKFSPGRTEARTKYTVSVKSNNEWRYHTLEDVNEGDSFEFSFADMEPYYQTVNFQFPSSENIDCSVYKKENGKFQYPYFDSWHIVGEKTTTDVPYPADNEEYFTSIEIGYSSYSLSYKNYGAIPDGTVQWPTRSDYSFDDKSFSEFSVSSSKPYVWRNSTWSYDDAASKKYVRWIVNSANTEQALKELPAEFINAYPFLSFSQLTLTTTRFYTESASFSSIIDGNFGGSRDLEQKTVSIYIRNP